MLRGIQLRLYLTFEQEQYALRLLGDCRFIYNHLVEFCQNSEKATGKIPTIKERYQFYKSLQVKFPFLNETHSKVRGQSRVDFDMAIQNHFNSVFNISNMKVNAPRFKKKGYQESCRFPHGAIIGVSGNRISLVRAFRDIHFKCSHKDMRFLNRHQKSLRRATLRHTATGKWMLSVLVNDETRHPFPIQTNPKYAGIDVGLTHLYTMANGEEVRTVENPKFERSASKRIGRAKTAINRRKKGGNRYKTAKYHYAKLNEKVANLRRNFLHQETTRLVRENQGIAVEGLNVAGMCRNHYFARSLLDVSWGMFLGMLKYKCEWYHRELVTIDRWFPSSRKCHVCGQISNITKDLSVREWNCPHCGVLLDRDGNAALNIRQEGFGKKLGLGSPEVTHGEREALTPAT